VCSITQEFHSRLGRPTQRRLNLQIKHSAKCEIVAKIQGAHVGK